MRTNIVLDADILEEAFKYSNAKTKKDLVREALVEYVAMKKKKNLIDLKGKIKFSKKYNHKELRENR